MVLKIIAVTCFLAFLVQNCWHSDVHIVHPAIPSSHYCHRGGLQWAGDLHVGILCVYSVYCAKKLPKQVQKTFCKKMGEE